MGTYVGASTYVISEGSANDSADGLTYATSNVEGAWVAGGMVATKTEQDAPGFGGATANATGHYSGSGELNSNFEGSAIGYSRTQVLTVEGMNGSINSSSAGMAVSTSTLPRQ